MIRILKEEFEDEGTLFIIEYETDKVLYLWEYDGIKIKKFPCLQLEIYEEEFFKLFGRQIYPLSEPIKPVMIDKKAKWNYMDKVGLHEHLHTEEINFDKLVTDINSYAHPSKMLTKKQKLILFLISCEPGIRDIYTMVKTYDRPDFPFKITENLEPLLDNDLIIVTENFLTEQQINMRLLKKGENILKKISTGRN